MSSRETGCIGYIGGKRSGEDIQFERFDGPFRMRLVRIRVSRGEGSFQVPSTDPEFLMN